MSENLIQDKIDAATFEFAMGNSDAAEQLLNVLSQSNPENFNIWHALTEVRYAEKNFKGALEAAHKAYEIDPNDLHINTSLSRIWIQFEDKPKAEHFAAQARMLGWKEELKNPSPEETL